MLEVYLERLTPQQLEPYLSGYLMGGWREDDLVLDSVEVERGRIRGMISARAFYMPGDGTFHLTVPSVFIWVSQLAIIYACWEQCLPRKPGEIYVREIDLKCRRPVTSPRDIRFSLTLTSQRRVPEGIYYCGAISVDDGAFIGDGRFILPQLTPAPPLAADAGSVPHPQR